MKRLSVLWTNNKVRSECRIYGDFDPIIESVSFSSHTCSPNSVFIAMQGLHFDGHAFIGDAIANGAKVIVHSKVLAEYAKNVVYIHHPTPRRIASLFCHTLAGPLPSSIIGITGTDGKSTTCDFLYQILQSMGRRCGILSTISMDDGSGLRDSPYRQSTPEAPELYAFLVRCYNNGIQTVLLETTSHGLSVEGARLIDLTFAGAIFTTITSEHLEFHQTHKRYVEAKMNLARQVVPGGWVVLPHPFPYYSEVESAVQSGTRIITYSLDTPQKQGDIPATTVSSNWHSRTLALSPSLSISLPYGPSYYAHNALGAYVAASKIMGKKIDKSLSLASVPGRFEIVATDDPCTIIIDFAHTADAFERLFSHLHSYFPHRRLIVLFGAAGERDRSKRFPMGKSAAQWCDAIFLTDEDPRQEPPAQIEDEIRQGIESVASKREVFSIPNRQQAIETAIEFCTSSDILILLGKGHEKTIQYPHHQISWNEHDVVANVLQKRSL